jgi:hypothetical protein
MATLDHFSFPFVSPGSGENLPKKSWNLLSRFIFILFVGD